MQGTPQCLHPVARGERRTSAKIVHHRNHVLTTEHTGDEMRNRGDHLATARMGQIGKKQIRDAAGDIREGVAVEEKERRAAMASPEELQRL